MDDKRLSSSALLIAVGNGGCYGGGYAHLPQCEHGQMDSLTSPGLIKHHAEQS